MDDDDGPGDESVELAPELIAIATSKRNAKSSADSSSAPQVTLMINFIPHPKDEEGEIQTFKFEMRQVSRCVSSLNVNGTYFVSG